MHNLQWEPQLSALALLDAYRKGSFDAVKSITMDTNPVELYMGLVSLAQGLLFSMAAVSGCTPDEMTDTLRRGMYKAAVAE